VIGISRELIMRKEISAVLRRISYSAQSFNFLTEFKKELKLGSKKVKVVYKHLYTSFKNLSNFPFLKKFSGGISTGGYYHD
jgi:hypothetical protein